MATYKPKTVSEAWKNHFDAFGAQDVDKILLDYDDKSIITVWDTSSNNKTQYKGLDGARNLFTTLFGQLSDLSTLKAPVVDVEEDIGNGSGQVFLVWECPGSGVSKATDTFLFRPDFKIGRQNIVTFASEQKSKPTIYYWPMAGRAGAAIRMLDEAKVDYNFKSEFGDIASVASAFGAEGSAFAAPIIVDGDVTVGQSNAVAMFVGQKYGFDVPEGQTVRAVQMMDDYSDFFTEFQQRVTNIKTDQKKFFTERMHQWMAMFERNCQGPFFFGKQMTYVDFIYFAGFGFIKLYAADQLKKETGIDMFAKSPKMLAMFEKMQNLDSVKNSKIPVARDGFIDKFSDEALAAINKVEA